MADEDREITLAMWGPRSMTPEERDWIERFRVELAGLAEADGFPNPESRIGREAFVDNGAHIWIRSEIARDADPLGEKYAALLALVSGLDTDPRAAAFAMAHKLQEYRQESAE